MGTGNPLTAFSSAPRALVFSEDNNTGRATSDGKLGKADVKKQSMLMRGECITRHHLDYRVK